MEKKQINKYQKLGLCLLPCIIAIVIFAVIAVKSGASLLSATTDKKNDSTYSYCTGLNYHIDNNATKLQKELFSELNEAIKDGDEVKIAASVAKNFCADFFNWTDKQDTYDVGGMYYVLRSKKTNVYDRARASFYKYLTTYIDEYGREELLEVKNMEVLSADNAGEYEFEGKKYPTYFVRVHWEYEDHKFDTYGFLDTANAQIVKMEDNRFEIVEFYGDY